MVQTARHLVKVELLVVVGLWIVFLPANGVAQEIKPGLWKVEQVVNTPGAPQGDFKSEWEYCVKEEEAKQGPVFSQEDRSRGREKKSECRIENLRYLEHGRVTYDIVCGEKAARINVEYRYTETTFEGTSRMVSDGRSFTYKLKGRYIGPCKE